MRNKMPGLYVAGLLFYNRVSVALVTKAKPNWQRGKLNGVGGSIERGESPREAMYREFGEETGITLSSMMEWREFCVVKGRDWRVHWFAAHTSEWFLFTSLPSEPVEWYPIQAILEHDGWKDSQIDRPLLPHVHWLIPMALDQDNLKGTVHDPS